MPVNVKLGRLPAVKDDRVPLMSDLVSKKLPAPPESCNHYAAIGDWLTLGNDNWGDCAEAAAAHADYQMRDYAAGEKKVSAPTEDETLAAYSAATGFDPKDPSTDQGTVIMGKSGMMEYWHSTGFVFGGARSFARAYARVKMDTTALCQAIHYLGGVLLGINMPANVVSGDGIPYMWNNPTGRIAGGHAVWVNGYQSDVGVTYFDLISWGTRCRMSQPFLEATFQEAVAVYDPAVMDKRGLNPSGFDVATLMNAMRAIRAA